MPCHVRSARTSHHRRSLFASKPSPKPLAVLDLAKPGERQVHDFIYRATSGPHPCWRLLGMQRAGDRLRCTVQWVQLVGCTNAYTEVEFDVGAPGGVAMRWRDHGTAAEAQPDIGGYLAAASPQAS